MYNKIKNICCFILILCLVLSINIFAVYAADSRITIYEPTCEDNQISVYLKGTSEDSVSVQIGTSLAEVVSNKSLTENGSTIYSLILIDNSKSIKKSDRTRTSDLVSGLILGRLSNEKLAVATFNNNHIEYLCDYSDDGINLQNALSGIEYGSHKSYLTDILYDLCVDNEIVKEGNAFFRVILVSDGSDHDGGKYRDEELEKVLKEKKIPIYTVYCNEKNDTENIKWFTSLARVTDAADFNLTESKDLNTFVRQLQEDANIRKIVFSPEEAMLDGTEKMVKITAGEQSASQLIKMPQTIIDNTKKQTDDVDKITEPPITEKPVSDTQKETENKQNGTTNKSDLKQDNTEEEPLVSKYLPFIIGGAAVLLIAIGIIIWLVLRRKNNSNEFENVSDDRNRKSTSNIETEVIKHGNASGAGDGAHNIFRAGSAVRLTSLSGNWEQQFSITDSVIIGRSHEQCGCVIDFDPSISRTHCKITKKKQGYYLTNLSRNGTKIDDAEIASEVELISGTVITLGRTQIKFEIISNGSVGTQEIF